MIKQRKSIEDIVKDEIPRALSEKQFFIFFQPKYSLYTNKLSGSEALVRWKHPEYGEITPQEFIPLLEQSGVVTLIDHFVWEETCKYIRKWMDEGRDVKPVSVNVSRVSLLDRNIVDFLLSLRSKYGIPKKMLEVEITESAFSENPWKMIQTVAELSREGFKILMDDFGSGYSSLSLLKDLPVDMLKIDMQFLAGKNDNGRGNNIIASIIRMSKWLKIPVVVEGVETKEQVCFLKSVNGDYAQGYYYNHPLPSEEFEKVMAQNAPMELENAGSLESSEENLDELFKSSPQLGVIFGDLYQALAIVEYDEENKTVSFVRLNEGCINIIDPENPARKTGNPLFAVEADYREKFLCAFGITAENRGSAQCDYLSKKTDGNFIWINMQLRYIKEISMGRHLMLAVFDDISVQKKIDLEMDRLRRTIFRENDGEKNMMIVDELEENRTVLKKIFNEDYNIIEAIDGVDALEKLRDNPHVDIIILDILMSKMNGFEFMKYKRQEHSISNIPIVVITSEEKYSEQMNALDLGAKDYIIKPFVPEVVRRRVKNVVDSEKLLNELIKKYDYTSQLSKMDKETGLFDMETAVKLINQNLNDFQGAIHSLSVFHVVPGLEEPDEKQNDVIKQKTSEALRRMFRGNDITFRIDENTFGVFERFFANEELLLKRYPILVRMVNGSIDHPCRCFVGNATAPEDGTKANELLAKAMDKMREVSC